jgi:hypothetical protein
VAAHAGNFSLESVGAQGGFSTYTGGDNFYFAAAILKANLPWQWEFGSDFRLQTRLDLSVGTLGDRDKNARMGSLGPSLLLKYKEWPVSIEGGSCPTLLSRYTFGSKNFGMPFQFISYIGVNWDVASHWRLGYDFEHMSNAHLASQNAGLNLHVIGLSYLF